jgi:hypothetical protein
MVSLYMDTKYHQNAIFILTKIRYNIKYLIYDHQICTHSDDDDDDGIRSFC